MPASLQRSPKPIDVHCVPWLLRWISASDRRYQSAMFIAPSTSSVRGRDPMDQPTTWRFQASTAPRQAEEPARDRHRHRLRPCGPLTAPRRVSPDPGARPHRETHLLDSYELEGRSGTDPVSQRTGPRPS